MITMRNLLREFVVVVMYVVVIVGIYFIITLITDSPTIRVIGRLFVYLMIFSFVIIFIYSVISLLFRKFTSLVGSLAYMIVKEEKKTNVKEE